MILLLGASGYIGEALATELRHRKMDFISLARKQVDYTRFDVLLEFLRAKKPAFVINAAGYTGKPNVDACELAKADTLLGNALLPQTIAHACATLKIPWGHVSSGCIFSGAKIVEGGKLRMEKDLTKPGLRPLADNSPAVIQGFTKRTRPIFPFATSRAVFTAAAKRSARKPSRVSGKVTSGGCGFRLMNSITHAIT
ncbi:MAG: sugar nucleotide-binding protein [Limisphaerales bacterium]